MLLIKLHSENMDPIQYSVQRFFPLIAFFLAHAHIDLGKSLDEKQTKKKKTWPYHLNKISCRTLINQSFTNIVTAPSR